jgi:hypothetical protein
MSSIFHRAILNYMVSSNHVHLLAVDDGGRDVIPKSMQLIAGRTGQEYNQRKDVKVRFGKIAIMQLQSKGAPSFAVPCLYRSKHGSNRNSKTSFTNGNGADTMRFKIPQRGKPSSIIRSLRTLSILRPEKNIWKKIIMSTSSAWGKAWYAKIGRISNLLTKNGPKNWGPSDANTH